MEGPVEVNVLDVNGVEFSHFGDEIRQGIGLEVPTGDGVKLPVLGLGEGRQAAAGDEK
jgi:hypothetical protein